MRTNIAETLRETIKKDGISHYRLAKETNIAQSTITRFCNGADVHSEKASILAEYFGLDLLPKEISNN